MRHRLCVGELDLESSRMFFDVNTFLSALETAKTKNKFFDFIFSFSGF